MSGYGDGGTDPAAICGARRKDGSACDARPAPGKRRCRLHGGAPGSGAPKGNGNALKHGAYTARNRARIKTIRAYVRANRDFMRAVKSGANPAALIRYHAAIERIAQRLAATMPRIPGA